MAEDPYRQLPYLSQGQAPEGEERAWGYRLETERGQLYLAPLSGDEIYVVSDCIDAEGLADKRGLTPRPYRFNVLLERSEQGFRPREGSATIGLMSGQPDGPEPERQRVSREERLEQFGSWLLETVSSWAFAHPEHLVAAAEVERHNRAVDLKEDIALTARRLDILRAELREIEGPERPALSDEASPAPAPTAAAPELER